MGNQARSGRVDCASDAVRRGSRVWSTNLHRTSFPVRRPREPRSAGRWSPGTGRSGILGREWDGSVWLLRGREAAKMEAEETGAGGASVLGDARSRSEFRRAGGVGLGVGLPLRPGREARDAVKWSESCQLEFLANFSQSRGLGLVVQKHRSITSGPARPAIRASITRAHTRACAWPPHS